MTTLRLNITMSLDGYVAGPNQSVAHPLGEALVFSTRLTMDFCQPPLSLASAQNRPPCGGDPDEGRVSGLSSASVARR
jgi:hypothetical protein